MARPSPTLASVAADLARLIAGERPAWVPAPLWRRVRAEALDLAAAVTATLAREGVVRAAEALGVHRDTLHAWRAPGGWLCTTEPREGEP